MIDLSALPPPDIIVPLDFEADLAVLLADFSARAPDHAELLESDPVVKLLETGTYHGTLLTGRINNSFRATLLADARGADLDHLAAFYEVSRLAGETDDSLSRRLRLKIQGWSAAGSEASYRYFALSADPARIRDVGVDSPQPGEVAVHVLPAEDVAEDDGSAPADLLDAVRAVVQRPDVRSISDRVTVQSATVQTVTLTADVWLLPATPPEILERAAAAIRAAHAAEGGLGWDFEPSWAMARLHLPGVQSVRLTDPAGPLPSSPGTVLVLGTIDLRLAGRRR